MRSFPSQVDAEAFIAATRPGQIRWVGQCQACGAGAAVSTPAVFVASADLFGVYTVMEEPSVAPEGDPCGHGSVRWSRVRYVSGPHDACSEKCRDALGDTCSCSCLTRAHGANHRIRSSSPT